MRTPCLTALLALALAACSLTVTEPAGNGSSSGGLVGPCAPGEAELCYDGPAATRDVGACHGGMRTCAADGKSFGACVGEVVPQPESCVSTDDLDCNGSVGDCTGAQAWKAPITGTFEPGGIAASPDGEVTFFGWAQTLDLGTGPVGDPTAWSLVVARLGADGSVRWTRDFAGVDPSKHAGGIVMNAAHEATLALYVEGAVTIDQQTFGAAPSGVLALRFDDAGKVAKGKLIDLGAPAATLAPLVSTVRLTPAGAALVGGAGFLAQLDAGLATTWHHRYAGDLTIADLSFAADGSLFAAGTYTGSFEPGGGATAVSGFHAGFLAQLDGAKTVWSQTVGEVETSVSSVVARADGTLSFGGLQSWGGAIVGGGGNDVGAVGYLAQRSTFGHLTGGLFGWGGRVPVMSMDASGDTVTEAVGVDSWPQTVLFKTWDAGDGSSSVWTQTIAWAPAVTCTIAGGETFLVTPLGAQRLAR